MDRLLSPGVLSAPSARFGLFASARFIGMALTAGSIVFACRLIVVAKLCWEEVMFNERYTEPSLDELFGDSAMRLLMRRDGVTESDIRALLCELKDARAVAVGGTKRGPGAPSSWRRRETDLRSPESALSISGDI